jgi:hypothetical protein
MPSATTATEGFSATVSISEGGGGTGERGISVVLGEDAFWWIWKIQIGCKIRGVLGRVHVGDVPY